MQKRQNLYYIFVVFLVLSLLVFFLFRLPFLRPVTSFAQNIFSPIQKITHNTLGTISNFFSNSKVEELRQENLTLSQKLIDQSKIEADNKALRDQFTTQFPKSKTLLEADIIGSSSFIPNVSMPESFILDKGEMDKVKKGQTVIYKDNLVGIITSVSQNESLINLLTNSSFSITVQTLSNNTQGVAKGQGAGEIILDNVLLSDSLKKDDLVVTKGDAGLNGSGILPNLVLGKINSINKNPSSLFQTAKVQPLIDFSHLQKVFIVINFQ